MEIYNYKEGKKRVESLLKSKLEIEKTDPLPKDEAFTYTNGYKSWVSAIFVDIRDSTVLFQDEDEVKISKIVRSFTSEVIRILRRDSNDNLDDKLHEIGIRGDCVYAIYATPNKLDEYDLAKKTFYINTFMEMLNKLLSDNNFPTIKVGVGMSTAQELVVKTGQKGTGISNNVWIGKAVTTASNLSSLGNKGNVKSLVFSRSSFTSFIEIMVKEVGEKAINWFTLDNSREYGEFYHSSVIISEFNKWVSDGMKD